MEALRALLVPALLPEICFEAMRERPLHAQCLKILLSKSLGYGIVVGSVLVKLPQLLKIYGARSGAGLSVGAVGLELLALGGSVAYSVGHGFPFSAWGEALFLLLQTLAIGFLILHYGGRTAWGLLLLLLYVLLLAALLSPWAPPPLVTALQAANVPIIVGGRLLQAAANRRQRHTGQLSALSTAMMTGGAAARVFTSAQVEPPQGVFRDDTALNGIRLLCNERGVVTSSEGLWGEWLSATGCPRSSRIISFRLRVEPPRGLRDDTAANDASFVCSDGTVLEGGGGERGLWGNWSHSCPPNLGVCGLRTRVEAPQRTRDDTGLNSAALLCCN